MQNALTIRARSERATGRGTRGCVQFLQACVDIYSVRKQHSLQKYGLFGYFKDRLLLNSEDQQECGSSESRVTNERIKGLESALQSSDNFAIQTKSKKELLLNLYLEQLFQVLVAQVETEFFFIQWLQHVTAKHE